MIVGVVAVNMMQAPIMDEVDMGAVLNALVFFAVMAVGVIVSGDTGAEFLRLGIGGADIKRVLIDMTAMRMVEVAVMQVIDMARVFERLMPAGWPMGMSLMPAVKHFMCHDGRSKKWKRKCRENKGPVHENALQMRRSQDRHTRFWRCRRIENS